MCTLTVVPLPSSAVRIAFNRDESRTRPIALPPQLRHVGERAAVFPTDPTSGGTWLAVNDAGLTLAVLNVNLPDRDRNAASCAARPVPRRLGTGSPQPPHSRGEIIPSLLEFDSPPTALRACERLNYRDFAPFRLVLIGDGLVANVRWDGREAVTLSRSLGNVPQMFTSSGLGDHLVESVRRELFEGMFAIGCESWPDAQGEFHGHRWLGREHLSVNMSRETARTVSHSVIDIDATEIVFAYHPESPEQPAELTVVRLPRVPPA